jgi:hypothetical protein
MQEGIDLFSQKYSVDSEDQDKLAIAYWVWIGLMTVAMGIGFGFFKAKKIEEAGGAETEEKVKAVGETPEATDHEDVILSA